MRSRIKNEAIRRQSMRRYVAPIFTYVAALLLLLAFGLTVQATTGQSPRDIPPRIATTVTTPPVFSATMTLIPSQPHLAVGETLVMTVSIKVSQGCSFPIYELTLHQIGNDGPIFEYLSPPTHTVGPPVSNPFSYTLTAITTGTVVFGGQAYGERYCGDFWNWTYVNGASNLVRVGAWPNRTYLPVIYKGLSSFGSGSARLGDRHEQH